MAENIGTAQVRIGANLDEFEKKMGRVSKTLKEKGDQFTKVGKKMTRNFTLPIVAGAGATVKAFADFDDKMNQSLAIMGEVSGPMSKQMKDAAREVGRTTRLSATEAAESYFFLASAGLDAEQSISALPAVAQFAQAGMFDMSTATDLATDAQSALGLVSEDTQENFKNLTRVTDVLVGANTLANASVEQFSTSLTREAGAALKSMNKDVEEGVAVLAAFADQGVKGERAGTGLSRIIRLMTQAANNNKDEMKELGLEVFDAEGNMRNMADIVENLEDSLGGMSDQQRTAALESIGFTARVQGMLLPLLGTSDAIREYEGELRNMGGITKEVADNQLDSFAARMDLVKSNVMDLAIEIGEALAPLVSTLAEKIGDLVNWFRNLRPETKRMIGIFLGVLAALGPILIVFGTMIKIGALLSSGVAKIAGAFRVLRTVLIFFQAHPIILFLTGLIALLVWLENRFGIVTKAVGWFGDKLDAIGLGGFLDAIGSTGLEVERFGEDVSEATQEAVGGFLDMNDEVTRTLTEMKITGAEATGELADSVIDNAKKMRKQVVSELEDQKQEVVDIFREQFKDATDISEEEQEEILGSVREGYDERIKKIEEAEKEINKIIEKASIEKRKITVEEFIEIDKLRNKIVNEGVRVMSNGEKEQRIILERIRDNTSKITAEQAREVAKNAINQRDQTVKEAEKQFDETLGFIIRQRDETGVINDEQAQHFIDNAKDTRDETVGIAEDVHDETIILAKNQAGEHVKTVDWETGEVKTKWQRYQEWTDKNNKKLGDSALLLLKAIQDTWDDIVTAIGKAISTIGGYITDFVNDNIRGWRIIGNQISKAIQWFKDLPGNILRALGNMGSLLFNTGKDMINGLIWGAGSVLKNIGTFLLDKIPKWIVGPFKKALGIESPSKVFMGLGEDTMAGFNVGLGEGLKDPLSSLTDSSRRFTQTFASGIEDGLKMMNQSGNQFAGAMANSTSVSTVVHGGINIGNQQQSEDFLGRLTRNRELAKMGLSMEA